MALIDSLLELSRTNQVLDLERIQKRQFIAGDFEGSVQGKWVKLASSGAGIVSYNGKEYTTVRIGFTALKPGTSVELTHANGVYYSKW